MKTRTITRTMTMTALLAFVASLLVAAAQAQPRRGLGPPPDRQDLEETVEIYMTAKLKRFLNLDERQTKTVIPLVEELNASRREFRRARRSLVRTLQPLAEDETLYSADDVTDTLDRLYGMEREHRESEARSIEEIRAALSPVQQARFLLFQERFRQEMEQRLRGLMRDRPER